MPLHQSLVIFPSTVSSEYKPLRIRMMNFIGSENFFLHRSQEVQKYLDAPTLVELHRQLTMSHFVFHLIGSQRGASPSPGEVDELLKILPKDTSGRHFQERFPEIAELAQSEEDLVRPTYTQWEAYLAVFIGLRLFAFHDVFRFPYEHGEKPKFKGELFEISDLCADAASQVRHYQRLMDIRGYEVWPEQTKPATSEEEATLELYSLLMHKHNSLKDETLEQISDFTHPSQARLHVHDTFFQHVFVDTKNAIGREKELQQLDSWLEDPTVNAIIFSGVGGLGKSTLARTWLDRYKESDTWDWEGVFCFRFNEETGAEGINKAITECLAYLGLDPGSGAIQKKIETLSEYLRLHKILLIWDGIEPLLTGHNSIGYEFFDPNATNFFNQLFTAGQCNSCVIFTSYWVPNSLKPFVTKTSLELEPLDRASAAKMAGILGVRNVPSSTSQRFNRFYAASGSGNPLLLTLMCRSLRYYDGRFSQWVHVAHEGDEEFMAAMSETNRPVHPWAFLQRTWEWFKAQIQRSPPVNPQDNEIHLRRVLNFLRQRLEANPNSRTSLALLEIASAMVEADSESIESARIFFRTQDAPNVPDDLLRIGSEAWRNAVRELRSLALLEGRSDFPSSSHELVLHGRVRRYFAAHFKKQHPSIWQELDVHLMHHFSERASEENGESQLSAARLSVFHGCRSSARIFPYGIFQAYLQGTHGENTLDIYPKIGSHSENLAALRPFFKSDWSALKEDWRSLHSEWDSIAERITTLKKEEHPHPDQFLARTAAFSLRTQGLLTQSLQLFEFAQGCVAETLEQDLDPRYLSQEIRVSEDSIDSLMELGTLYGLIAKVRVLKGDLRIAFRESEQGLRLLKQIFDSSVSRTAKQEERIVKYLTAILADIAAVEHLRGNYIEAGKYFQDAEEFIAKIAGLKAERMVQHCEFLLDSGDFDKVTSLCDAADTHLENTPSKDDPSRRMHEKEMLFDYAVNGYVHARLIAEKTDNEFWQSIANGVTHSFADQEVKRLAALLHVPSDFDFSNLTDYQINRQSRSARMDSNAKQSQTIGDLIFAITMLERIGRFDWLPKVYCVAAMSARLLSQSSTTASEAKHWFELAKQHLQSAERILRPDNQAPWESTSLRTFTCDYLIESARFNITFAGKHGIDSSAGREALAKATDVIKKTRYGRLQGDHLASHLSDLELAARKA